jgi:hypothetical protein
MGENRDPRLPGAFQKAQDEFIDQRRLARATRPGKTNDARFA